MDKALIIHGLEQARDYLLAQDTDNPDELETAADLIGRLRDEVEMAEGWETVIALPVRFDWS